MRKFDTKIFLHDKAKLYQLVNLRLIGLSTSSLGILFNCDRSSVENQLNKYWIKPQEQVYTIERIIMGVLPQPKEERWYEIDGQKFNKGKTYKEYVAAGQAREYPHRNYTIKGLNLN